MNDTPARAGAAADRDEQWVRDWHAMVALAGTDLSDGTVTWGADRVEPGTIRRYLEPLELGCPLHYDEDIARRYGHPGLVAPATSILAYALPPMWRPDELTLFSDDDPDAQPDRSPISYDDRGVAPPTTGFFATDIEMDFVRPVTVGERLGQRGRRLLSCIPKETSVGRGAFMTSETEIVSDRGDVVARVRTSVYAYNPHPDGSQR
jgi:hypothetical protein